MRNLMKALAIGAVAGFALACANQARATILFNEDFADVSEWSLDGTNPWTTTLNDGDETVVIAGGSPINTYAMPSQNQIHPAGITSALGPSSILDVNLAVRMKGFPSPTAGSFQYTLFSENPQVPGDIATITLFVKHPTSNGGSDGQISLLVRQATGIDPATDITVFSSGLVGYGAHSDSADPFPIDVSRDGTGLWTVDFNGSPLISGTESILSTGLKIDYIRFQEFTDSSGGTCSLMRERRSTKGSTKPSMSARVTSSRWQRGRTPASKAASTTSQ